MCIVQFRVFIKTQINGYCCFLAQYNYILVLLKGKQLYFYINVVIVVIIFFYLHGLKNITPVSLKLEKHQSFFILYYVVINN